jgi:hypothetical protein
MEEMLVLVQRQRPEAVDRRPTSGLRRRTDAGRTGPSAGDSIGHRHLPLCDAVGHAAKRHRVGARVELAERTNLMQSPDLAKHGSADRPTQ